VDETVNCLGPVGACGSPVLLLLQESKKLLLVIRHNNKRLKLPGIVRFIG
jgi:hypothetical protein